MKGHTFYTFTTNIFNKLELDISDDNVQHSKKQSGTTFQATTVHHFPLVSARSVAHSNKLNAHANDIYVSLIEDDVSKSNSGHIF